MRSHQVRHRQRAADGRNGTRPARAESPFVTNPTRTTPTSSSGSTYRFDKNGEQIQRFDAFWREAVTALGEKMKAERLEPIDLHFHDLRRAAHFQMRKAGIDSQTATTSWITKAHRWTTGTP